MPEWVVIGSMSEDRQLAERAAAAAQVHQLQVAVAESLTGGLVSSRLAAAPQASRWFRGALIAYASDVKHHLLGVPAGSVVSQPAAEAMAAGVAQLLGADVALSLTGAGGPDPQDGAAPGTVWFGLFRAGRSVAQSRRLAGDPEAVCDQACTEALRWLVAHLEALGAVPTPP